MVRELVGGQLREQGFRRQRNRFARPSCGGWQLIDFQASQFGSRDDVSFTINLAAAYPELRLPDDSWNEARPPTEAAAHSRERVGFLLPGERDRWWSLTADMDSHAVAREIAGLLSDIAMPWLAARQNFESLGRLIRERPSELAGFELLFLPKRLEAAAEPELAALVREEDEQRHHRLRR